jgi:secreted PhoX family phosphatase
MTDTTEILSRRKFMQGSAVAAAVAVLPAAVFAAAADEYYLIESSNPKVQGLDGAVASFVEYLYALA